jgi:hypothetical protein
MKTKYDSEPDQLLAQNASLATLIAFKAKQNDEKSKLEESHADAMMCIHIQYTPKELAGSTIHPEIVCRLQAEAHTFHEKQASEFRAFAAKLKEDSKKRFIQRCNTEADLDACTMAMVEW